MPVTYFLGLAYFQEEHQGASKLMYSRISLCNSVVQICGFLSLKSSFKDLVRAKQEGCSKERLHDSSGIYLPAELLASSFGGCSQNCQTVYVPAVI